MDKLNLVMDHLEQTKRHIRQGVLHVARQQSLIEDLQRQGNTATAEAARHMLLQFEDSLALHVAERKRLETELAELRAKG